MKRKPHWLWILPALIVGLHAASAQTYTQLHSFAGGSKDGANPMGSLILSNNVLYGMTSQGGVAGGGVVFKMNTNGNSFTNLHSFSAYAGNGESPNAALVLSGSTLYGMTTAAVIVLRKKRPDMVRPYKTLGYPAVPVLFVAAAGLLIFYTLKTSPRESFMGLGVIAAGLPFYFYWKRQGRGES